MLRLPVLKVTSSRSLTLFFSGLALIAVALACSDGIPATQPAAEPTAVPTAASAAGADEPVILQPAILEQRRLTIEYPSRIHAGDSDLIYLSLEMDALGNVTPTAQTPGNIVDGQVIEIPNLYETHHVIAEARLDMAGLEVRPPEAIQQPLLPSQTVTFIWSVQPPQAGSYRGTAWLFLRFVDKVSGEESRQAISAQTVQIDATNLFGFSAAAARTMGTIGSVVGGILGFPFLGDASRYLFKRWKERKKTR